MKTLLIHAVFATPQDPGGTRHYEIARRLVALGHEVAVVAGSRNYLTRRRAHHGVGHTGLTMTRAWSPAGRSTLARLWGFATFMISSLVASLRVRGVDVVWGTTPPLSQALSALAVARLRRIPFVLEVRDLWPDFAVQLGVLRRPAAISLARRLERTLYRNAERIVVNSPGYVEHLTRIGIPEARIIVIPNGVDPAMFDPDDAGAGVRRELGLDGRFVVAYAGAQGMANDLETVVEAAARLGEDSGTTFLIVGDGRRRESLEARARRLGTRSVRFVGAQPKERIGRYLAAADVCVATLRPIPMFALTYPNKVFDYMAAGRPTILAIDGVIRKVVEEADAGVFVPPGDPQALADAVRRYRDDRDLRRRQGSSARAYVVERFDRAEHATAFATLLESVVSPRVGDPAS